MAIVKLHGPLNAGCLAGSYIRAAKVIRLGRNAMIIERTDAGIVQDG